MDIGTNVETKPMKEENLVFIERERAHSPLTCRLDPFRNFNFRLAGDSLRRSSVKDVSSRSISRIVLGNQS